MFCSSKKTTAAILRRVNDADPRGYSRHLREAAFRKAASVSGFTLIEVMITVAIIAILSAIALPSYRDYIIRGRLVNATNALSVTRARMEQFYQDNRTYFGGPCSTSQTVGDFKVVCDATEPAVEPTDKVYTIKATGTGTTDGFVYTIDQNAVAKTVRVGANWGTAASGSCWQMRKGESC
jgi:type IV pilus assembly protein PilE